MSGSELRSDSIPGAQGGIGRLFSSKASNSETNPTLGTPTHPNQNPASQALSPLKLLQLGINPKEQWVNKLLERTRTEEAKANGLAIYSAYDPWGLEQEFNTPSWLSPLL